MKIALTGHRCQRLGLPEDEKSSRWDNITNWIKAILEELINSEEVADIYCGMASGCDIKLGCIVAQMKTEKNIRLHCVLPCRNYNSTHPYYEEIKARADEWIELSDEFYKGCDNVRGQYMVDCCDVLLAIWDKNKSGGVWSTIRKAQRANKRIICCPKKVLNEKL